MSVTITAPSGQQLTMQGVPGSNTPVVESISGIPGSVEMRGETTARLGSGSILTPIYREPREITVKGWMHCTDQSVDVRRAAVQDLAVLISGMWRDGDELGTLRLVHAGMDRTCRVQPDQDGSWTLDASLDYRGWLRWSLDLIAPDPHLYGAARTMQLRPVDTGAGFVWPGFADGFADWGVSGGDEAQLTNAGNAAALPTVTVTVDDGSGFRLSSGARSVEWVGACSRSVPVVVDMAGQVLVGGVDRSAQLVRREWLSVPPRGVVSMSLSTLSGGGGSAIATVRDTWI